MSEEQKKLVIQKIITSDNILISDLEEDIAATFNISIEQLRQYMMESENVDELLDKLGIYKEV